MSAVAPDSSRGMSPASAPLRPHREACRDPAGSAGPPSQPLIWLGAAAAGGILVDRYLAPPPALWLILLAAVLLAWVGLRLRSSRREAFLAILVLLAASAVFGLWHHDRWRLFSPRDLAWQVADEPTPVLLRAVALGAPRDSPAAVPGPLSTVTREAMSRLEVRIESVRRAGSWRPAAGRAKLLVEGRVKGVLRGDLLEVAGLAVRPSEPQNPGEPNFASMARRRRLTCVVICEHPRAVRRLRAGWWGNPLRQLGRLRRASEKRLEQYVGSERGPLAAALLLGSRERLTRSRVERFFVTGTLHLLAISGLHVGILASAFWLLDRTGWCSRRWVLAAAALLTLAYALLTGARPPVVRAAILVWVFCAGRVWGRFPRPWNSLAAAGLITLAIRPADLFATGAQLSFLAVATLIAGWRWLAELFPREPVEPLQRLIFRSRPLWVRWLYWIGQRGLQLLCVSALVWLVTLPLVAWRFHLVSVMGVFLSVLLWLPVAGALFAALLAVVFSCFPLLPDVFGWVCDNLLAFVEGAVVVAAQWRWGYEWVTGPPWWWVVGYYLGLAVWQLVPRGLPRSWWTGILSVWLILAVLSGTALTRARRSAEDHPLQISFVSVGHGVCVLIEFPDGRTLLYDAGRMGSPRAAMLPISSVLWNRRIGHLDAVVLSHADADHFNALPGLLERFSVGLVCVGPRMFEGDAPAVRALRDAVGKVGVPVQRLHEGMVAERAGVRIEVLHPPALPKGIESKLEQGRGLGGEASERASRDNTHSAARRAGPEQGGRDGASDNARSVVLELTYGAHRVLLTGDLEQEGLAELLAELPRRCDILMAPHHGSRNSRPADVMQWARPRYVAVSGGSTLRLEDLEQACRRAGAKLLWTHREGCVQFRSDGRQLRVRTWRGGAR